MAAPLKKNPIYPPLVKPAILVEGGGGGGADKKSE